MIDVTELEARDALTAAVTARRTADTAEAELLAVAAHWADLHACTADEPAAGLSMGRLLDGRERLMPLAGDGTPRVAEFAPGELGAALGLTTYAATSLIGDALELRHRLPRLWARVHAGQLQAWRARQVAAHTPTLSTEAAAFVDAQLAPVAHKIGLGRVLGLVDVALRRYDPAAAERREAERAEGRGVWVSEAMVDGTRQVTIDADALDVEHFDASLNQIAEGLAALGDTDTKDVRRAKAVGVLADPQAALDLLTDDQPSDQPVGRGSVDDGAADHEAAGPVTAVQQARTETPDGTASPAFADSVPSTASSHAGASREQASAADPQQGRRLRRGPKPPATLYVHLSAAALQAGTGVARIEDLGPASLALVAGWLQRHDITLRPVLDLDDRTAVDAYETPDAMRETVLLRNPCCPFPWCNNLSRRKDLDHITPYVPPDEGGPPGQTAAHLLGSPCRRHHRYKTYAGWRYTMPEPGLHLWTSPLGQRYLVDHTGTQRIDLPA